MEPDQGQHEVSQDPLGEDDKIEYSEANTYSFIIKVWLEEAAAEAGQAAWRGRIIQVPGGEKRYLDNLDEIGAFILPYLERMCMPICDS